MLKRICIEIKAHQSINQRHFNIEIPVQSPAYQDVGYQKGGYQENALLDAVYQESPFPANASPPYIHATPITPPISPPLAEPEVNMRGNSRDVEDIIEVRVRGREDGK